jgi:hypothetical protein
VAQLTEADGAVAQEATEWLYMQGRHDLEVTADQVVRWRLAGLFELPPGPRQGRSNLRRYPDNAGEMAARFRILLQTRPNIEEALLLAYVSDMDVGIDGVRTSISRFLWKAGPKLKRARTTSKRSERFALPGPRQASDDATRAAIVDLFLGEEPLDPDWPELLIDRFGGPDATEHLLATGGIERLREVLRRVSIAGLSRTVRDTKRDELLWAAGTARSLVDFARAVSEVYQATGTTDSQLIYRAVASLGKRMRTKRLSGEFGVAFLAPVLLLMVPDRKGRQQLAEVGKDCKEQLPRLQALVLAANALPERWRPSLGAGGAALLASLPDGEAEELLNQLRKWLADHPEQARHVVLSADLVSEESKV